MFAVLASHCFYHRGVDGYCMILIHIYLIIGWYNTMLHVLLLLLWMYLSYVNS